MYVFDTQKAAEDFARATGGRVQFTNPDPGKPPAWCVFSDAEMQEKSGQDHAKVADEIAILDFCKQWQVVALTASIPKTVAIDITALLVDVGNVDSDGQDRMLS